jgi:MYXO-CTERM domain-containing protein
MKSVTTVRRLATIGSAFALALTATNAQASALTPGDLLIYRVGTGSGGLGSAATAVFLDEYSPLGTLVQSIALPTTGSAELTAVGNDATEGIITASQNGPVFNFTGYRADAGAANPSASAPGTVNRVIGTVGLNGVPITSTALTDASGTIRSAGSTDGSSLFYVGTSSGLLYYGSPSGASTGTLIDSRSSRQALVGGNTLFASGTAAGSTSKVLNYGTMPTGATTGTPVIATTLTDTVNGFALFDLSSSVAGPDTLYALSTAGTGKVYKYTFNGTSWAASGSIASNGAQDISGIVSGTNVDLFLTSGTKLYSEIDPSGFNANITGSLTTLATASANEGFRGVAYIPEPTTVPEPSTVGLGLLAAATLLALRRRRS